MQRRETHIPQENSVEELDALVLAEIESLARHTRPPNLKQTSASGPERRQSRVRLENRGKPVSASKVARIRGEDREGDVLSGEEAEELVEEPIEFGDLPGVEEDEHAQATTLFSAEEEAFVTRAVGFLARRDNADIILNRIWEQLTEADPEGFFRPEGLERLAALEAETKPALSKDDSQGSSGA